MSRGRFEGCGLSDQWGRGPGSRTKVPGGACMGSAGPARPAAWAAVSSRSDANQIPHVQCVPHVSVGSDSSPAGLAPGREMVLWEERRLFRGRLGAPSPSRRGSSGSRRGGGSGARSAAGSLALACHPPRAVLPRRLFSGRWCGAPGDRRGGPRDRRVTRENVT